MKLNIPNAKASTNPPMRVKCARISIGAIQSRV
jgi:hypothetical protein